MTKKHKNERKKKFINQLKQSKSPSSPDLIHL